MSKTYKSPGKFAGNWEIQAQSPLDDRLVVSNVSDLTDASTWKSTTSGDNNYYHYKGMVVSCILNNTLYVYGGRTGNATDVVNSDNWIAIKGSNLDSYVTDNVTLPDYYKLEVVSQEEYDALTEYDEHTLYYIPNDGHLINSPGAKGKSAYEIWLEQNEYESSEHDEAEFLESLQAVAKEWVGTLEEFDALSELDLYTTYYITE